MEQIKDDGYNIIGGRNKMKKEKSGCNGYYLDSNGKHCDVILTRDVKLSDCKKCSCPSNQYSREKK